MAKSSKNETKKRLVLLDSHAIIHRAYHALPDFASSKGEPTGALYGLSAMLLKIITDLHPDYVVACYDLPKPTFRHEAYDGYKAGRAKTDDALIAQLISSRRIFEAFGIPMYDNEGFEADDMLGTIVEQMKKEKSLDIIIASGDMDTLQLVDDERVQVFTLKKGINDTILYSEKAVVERFGFVPKLLPDYKGLRGDPSDNIIGIKGIGEKTATTLITTFGTIEQIYKALKKDKEQFKKAGLSDRVITLIEENEEEAMFSKTLATIRRDAPIKFELPKVEFRENFDMKKVETLFAEFEFRSLIPRVKTVFNIEQNTNQDDDGIVYFKKEDIDKDFLYKTSIALWIINSDMTNASQEDIMTFTGAKDFKEAHDIIFKKMKDANLDKVWDEIERPLMPVIKDMEKVGVKINKDFFKKLGTEYHKELDLLTNKIYKLADGEFNINSPKQLSEILFDKLGLKTKSKRSATGTYSTKVEVLEEIEDQHSIIKFIMEYRELQKLLSTYIDVLPDLASSDNRLHTTFLQHGSTTGRFSSINPNLQNIPIKTDLGKRIRDGFIADEGKKFIGFDYSQIELRVMAIMSHDKNLVEIFKDGKDVHASVASKVFGVSEGEVTADMRRKAKVINFGIIYGMGVTALKKNLGTSREEAQNFYDNYFTQFSSVRDYLDSTKDFAIEHMYTETLFGRRRQFPAIRSKIPFIKVMAERTATNAPIQGTAADILKLAIVHADKKIKENKLEDKVKLVLQIHDELIYEVDENVVDGASTIIKSVMENVLSESFIKYKTEVPLSVHYAVGDNWGELK
jgi:DNA polymerase-1